MAWWYMRRFRSALFLSLALAICLARVVVVEDIEVPSACSYLTPDSWLYDLLGCGKDSGGGGGSGAGN